MADFTALKTAIQTYIKQNGNEEITGDILQEILLSVVTTLGDGAINDLITALGNEATARQQADGTLQQNITNEATARGNADTALQGLINGVKNNVDNGYVYAGIATPSTTPVSGKVFYLALTAGTYANFDSAEVSQGINILKYNGSAWSLDAFIGIDDTPTPNSPKLVKSGGTFESVMANGSAFDISAHFASGGTLVTYADLSAALTALNTLSADYKRGGMSIKFVQSSDNKYLQYRFILSAFTSGQFVNVNNWIEVGLLQTTKCSCTTPAGTSVKVIALPGFVLSEHIHLTCWMNNPNTAQDVRLNINNTGAKEFYYNDKLNAADWEGGMYVDIIYSQDIDKYIMFPSPIIEQTLGNHSQRVISQKGVTDIVNKKIKCACGTLSDNANKEISINGFTLENPDAIRLLCWMSFKNTASEIPTLNINNTGAKRFYYCDVLATAETPLWDSGMYVDIVYASDIDCYAIYPTLRIEQTLGNHSQRVISQKGVTDAITDIKSTPFAKNLVGGQLILSTGSLYPVASCSYTKPINLSAGDTIIGEVATDQALLYKVITDGSSYQALVPGDEDDTRPQVFRYTAEENMQVAVSGYTDSIKVYGGVYGRMLGEIPLKLNLVEGKVILNDGNLWNNSLCSYTKPILLRRGEKIIGTEKCDQAFLFATDKNGSFFTPLVAGDGEGVEIKQFEYTAPYDMYVAFGGYTETLSAKVGLMSYFANSDTNNPESIMGNSSNAISQKAASEIIAHGDAKDDLLFDDTFELPVVPAQNGTDPNGIINLNTADVQDIYDLWDELVDRSNGYIQKEVLGKDQSDTYDILRFTCVNKYAHIGMYPNYTPVDVPVYKRKVVIDAQVHGRDYDPIDATFMVYWLAKFLVDEYGTNPVATWLRDTYMFIFLPLMNPWGVMNRTYGNSRNVNINWNYPSDNFVPNLTIDYGTTTGSAPASEKETQYIVNTLLAHKDLFAWMDVHSWNTVGYKVFYSIPDDYLHPYNEKRMLQVTQYAMSKVSGGRALWWKDYGGAGGGYIQGWSPYYGAKNLGIWCPHMEMCNKNGGGTAFSSDALTSDFYTLVGQLMFK